MKKLIFTILLAAVLWTVMFSPWTAPFVNFWWMMTGSALTLSVFATLFNPGWWREVKWSLPNVLLGIGIAVALWGVFWLGDKVSSWMFDFARPQVDSIYGMKEGESPWLLAALLLLLIGPAAEGSIIAATTDKNVFFIYYCFIIFCLYIKNVYLYMMYPFSITSTQ